MVNADVWLEITQRPDRTVLLHLDSSCLWRRQLMHGDLLDDNPQADPQASLQYARAPVVPLTYVYKPV